MIEENEENLIYLNVIRRPTEWMLKLLLPFYSFSSSFFSRKLEQYLTEIFQWYFKIMSFFFDEFLRNVFAFYEPMSWGRGGVRGRGVLEILRDLKWKIGKENYVGFI